MALINSLCAMLRTTPFHRDNYSRLVLSVIIQFYQRCSDRFQDVVSRNSQDLTDTRLLVAARWAQQDEIATCLGKLMGQVRQSLPLTYLQPNWVMKGGGWTTGLRTL